MRVHLMSERYLLETSRLCGVTGYALKDRCMFATTTTGMVLLTVNSNAPVTTVATTVSCVHCAPAITRRLRLCR